MIPPGVQFRMNIMISYQELVRTFLSPRLTTVYRTFLQIPSIIYFHMKLKSIA